MEDIFVVGSILILILPVALSVNKNINKNTRIRYFLVFPIFQLLVSILILFAKTNVLSVTSTQPDMLWQLVLLLLIISITKVLI